MSTPFQQPPNFPPSQPPVKKTSTGKILLIIGGSIIAFLVLVGGCTAVLGNSVANSDGPVAITPSSSSPTTKAPAPSSEPSAEPSTNFEDETEPDSGGDIAKVGQDTWAWEDGLEAEVTSLKWVDAAEYSESTESYVLQVSVRYTNNSPKAIDLDLSQIEVSYGEDGDSAEVDYYADEYGATGSLPPGKKKTGKTSFLVTKKQAESGLLIQVTPDWEHDPAIFEG